MSRRKLKARDKVTQKMSRDGLVERNESTGEDIRLSKREADFDIRSDTKDDFTLSQVGTRLDDKPDNQKKTARRHSESLRETVNTEKQDNAVKHDIMEVTDNTAHPARNQSADTFTSQRDPPKQQDSGSEIKPPKPHEQPLPISPNKNNTGEAAVSDSGKSKLRAEESAIFRHETTDSVFKHEQPKTDTTFKHQRDKADVFDVPANNTDRSADKPRNTLKQKRGKLNKRQNTKYQQQQTSSIQHEPPKDAPLKQQPAIIAATNQSGDKTGDKSVSQSDRNPNLRGNTPKQETLSQVGTRSRDKPNKRKKTAYRQDKPAAIQHEPPKTDSQLTHKRETAKTSAAPDSSPVPLIVPEASKLKTQKDTALQHKQPGQTTDLTGIKTDTPPEYKDPAAVTARTEPEQVTDTPKAPVNSPRNPLEQRSGKFRVQRNAAYKNIAPAAPVHETVKPGSRLTHTDEKTVQAQQSADAPKDAENEPKPKTSDTDDAPVQEDKKEQAKAPASDETDNGEKSDAESLETETPSTDITTPEKPQKRGDKPDSQLKQDKPGKLKFTEGEAAAGVSDAPEKPTRQKRNLIKAEKQAEIAGKKLEKAKNKLPAKKKLRSERVFDEAKGKAKRKLYFEKEIKPQGQHLKGSLPMRPVKLVTNTAILNAHRKIFQVENENVSVKAAHRIEMVGEAGVRSALRFRKTAPYRKVARLEKKAAKKSINLSYRKAIADNPKLKSNMFSRMWQKRKIKKDYAKKARDAKRAAGAAKKGVSATVKAAKKLALAVIKNPKVAIILGLIILIILLIMTLISLGSSMGGGGLTAILTSSYLAEDEDIESAALAYSEWETDLQFEILNTETTHPGYDEYRYNIGEISHNPFELMAYLTAVYHNFPFDAVSADLQALFNEQYTLTFTPSVETRYRTVTRTDPDTGESYEELEAYDWHVMTVALTARSFSELVMSKMTVDQQAHYAILMQTRGNRQYVGSPFDVGWLPFVSSHYGWRVHPITGVKDLHRGVDIALPAGTEIKSAQDGTVTFAGNSGGYGNVVIIENDKGIVTKYAHCETILVSAGQIVTMGDVIATVGSTGSSTGNHLHFEVLVNGEYLNPLFFADTGSFSLSPVFGIPGTPMSDGTFAALLEEAEKYLGFPYVWGGSSPETSFDCSGFISYILRASGVRDVGRQTAQGLYNLCTLIPPSAAQPGDLVFFHSTYSTPNLVTHVGLYVGDGWMIHAGSPIEYARIDSAYWQSKFLAFGRIN